MRHDADGRVRIGPTWESITERLIREAQEAGEFDDLPGRGRRLELDDDPREGAMGLAFHLLRTNDTVPPWIAADREARRCAARIERLLADAAHVGRTAGAGGAAERRRAWFHARLREAMTAHAHAVEALDSSAPSVRLHRRRFDGLTLRARLEHALDGLAAEPGPDGPSAEPGPTGPSAA